MPFIILQAFSLKSPLLLPPFVPDFEKYFWCFTLPIFRTMDSCPSNLSNQWVLSILKSDFEVFVFQSQCILSLCNGIPFKLAPAITDSSVFDVKHLNFLGPGLVHCSKELWFLRKLVFRDHSLGESTACWCWAEAGMHLVADWRKLLFIWCLHCVRLSHGWEL